MFGLAQMMSAMHSGSRNGMEGGPHGRRLVQDAQSELTDHQRSEIDRIRSEKTEECAKANENIGMLLQISHAVTGVPASPSEIDVAQVLSEYGDRTNKMMPCVSFILEYAGDSSAVVVSHALMERMRSKAVDEIAENLESEYRKVVRTEKLMGVVHIDDDGDVFFQNEMIRPGEPKLLPVGATLDISSLASPSSKKKSKKKSKKN